MKRFVIYRVTLLIGVCMLLYCAEPIRTYAKEDDVLFGGGGTKYNPYLISSYEDIATLRDEVDDGNDFGGIYFLQTEDISFPDGINWNPIGDLEHGFAGIYDGNGHILSNIYCDDPHAGFFSLLVGEVRNLGIEDGCFSGDYIGSITSHGGETGRIINCYNKADVNATGRAGGIADNYPGLIMFCWNFGNVTATNEGAVAAGITSYGEADVRYCYAVGADKLVSEMTFAGEIIGSSLLGHEEVSGFMQQSYEDMFAVYDEARENDNEEDWEKDLVTRGNTVFMVCEGGDLRFDKEYEPEVFLREKQEERIRFQEIVENKYRFEGEGTKERPFLISSYEDLSRLRDCVDVGVNYEEQYFEQIEDIYFPDGENWNPIGDLEHAFAGTYDGGGHVISNVYCDDQYAGLFSLLAGEVRNLGIESGEFYGDYVGSITSHGGGNNARIINCYNKADVIGKYRAGGLIDNFQGELLFSWNLGTVSGSRDAILAGICSCGPSKVRYCYTTAEAEIVSSETFCGELYESTKIKNEDLEKQLRKNERIYRESIVTGVFEEDDISFLNMIGVDQIGFDDSYIPTEVMHAKWMGYLSEAILFGITVLLGGIIIAVWYRHTKCRKLEAESGKEENAGLNCITIDKKNQRKILIRRIRKRIPAGLLTVTLFLLTFFYTAEVCNLESPLGILNLDNWKKTENENTDILLVGGSSIAAHIEVGELWKERGIAAYCIGAACSGFYDSYYRLLEGDRNHSCKLIIVEVRGAGTNSDIVYEERTINITGVDMSLNKLHYINATIEPQDRLYFALNFPLYHGRYKELSKWDFLHTSSFGEEDKGNWMLNYGSNNTLELEPAADVVEYKALNQKQEYYLRKIIEYCEANDRDLLLLKTPDGNRRVDQPFYNTVTLIAEEYGVPFLDMNLYDEEIGLTSADFWTDNYHLNVEGARKCTTFLGDYLMENYMLLDHRGDEDYASWDRFAANREDLYLRAITDNTDYFNELHRDQRKIIAVSSEMSLEKSEQYLSVKEKLEDLEYEPYDAEDVLYGEENQNTWILGSNTVMVQKDYQERKISINGKINLSVDSPGIILIVYDEVTDQVADVAAFTNANGFSVQHLYEGGED